MNTTFKKRLSLIWVAFILLFSLTVPVTSVFANGNGGAAQNKEGYTMLKIEAGSLKDGLESNDIVSVTATLTEENEVSSISWTSEIPIYFVYVKGGPSGIETDYGSGATSGTGLIAPDNKGISHVAFYYKQEAAKPSEDEEAEESTENGSEKPEDPAEDTEPAEEQQNDESEEENNQEENDESTQEENNQEENDESTQEENNQEENDDSTQKENNQEDSDESNKEDKESVEDTKENAKENANKSTEIHLHLKNCTAPVEKVEVQLKGDWEEMSNPGNSTLYKLKDGGEFVKDEITAFRLSFESGEKQIYDMDDVKAGNEAEGSINYWLEGCSVEEEENTEEPGDGSEEPGEGNGDDGDENGEKSTEIHLHLKNCIAPVEGVFVELNGEWVEMSNPGNSPLYKLKDEGEYVKNDITAFKLVYKSGAERFYNLEDIRAGVEAEGSINYWIEDCAVPEDENTEEPGDGTEEPDDNDEEPKEDVESPDVTEIVKELYIIINKNIESVIKLTLLIDGGENIEFIKMNNLWKLIIANGLDVSDIKGIELEFEDGTTKVLLISKLSFELNDQVIHLEIDEAVLGIDKEEEADEDEGTGKSDNYSGNDGNGKQNWYGNVLPKTGESSKMMFYIAGFLLMAAGTGLRMRKPIKH